MSTTDNKQIARGLIEEGLNRRDLAAVRRFFSVDSVDQLKTSLNMYLVFSAFPDLQVNIEQMIAEGDKVTVLSTIRGTHRGSVMGIPPTGQGVTGNMATVFRFVDGKIAETWQNWDPWNLLRQIGITFGAMPANGSEHALSLGAAC